MQGESSGLILFKGCTLIFSTPVITKGINVVWSHRCFSEIGVSFNHQGGNYRESKIPLRREGCHYIRWNRFPIGTHWGFSAALEIMALLYLALGRSSGSPGKIITKKFNQSLQRTLSALRRFLHLFLKILDAMCCTHENERINGTTTEFSRRTKGFLFLKW